MVLFIDILFTSHVLININMYQVILTFKASQTGLREFH